jgi:hypothetical protein
MLGKKQSKANDCEGGRFGAANRKQFLACHKIQSVNMEQKCKGKCTIRVFYSLYYKEKDGKLILPCHPRKHVVINHCGSCGKITIHQ